jgi:hypothetical protein
VSIFSYYVGVDLSSRQDYTAISILEEPVWTGGWASPADLTQTQVEQALSANYYHGRPKDVPLSLRHLERLPLGTSYPKVVERVASLMASAPLSTNRCALVVDATGVGTAVVDALVEAGLYPMAVTIHGGDTVTPDGSGGFRVPKRDLVSAVQVLLQSGRLKIAANLPETETLERELLNFRMKIDPKTAHDSYSHWREGDHDDLVLATAIALWFRMYWNLHVDRANALREGGEHVSRQ